MKLRNKILEQITNQVLDEYKTNIEEFEKEAPVLVKKLQIPYKDPHVEQMINSFAIIQASYDYKERILANQQVTSILFNILDLKLHPPCGLLTATLTGEDNCIVKKNTIIKDMDNWYCSVEDSHINHIKITEKKIEIFKEKPHLVIKIQVENKNIKQINFFSYDSVISALFFNKTQKEVTIINRPEYTTTAWAKWKPPTTIQEAICFPQKFRMFTIEQLDMVGIDKFFYIAIPIEKNQEILHYPINTNEILVKNHFFDTTENIHFQEDKTEYSIKLPGKEIIDIHNIYAVTEEETIELPRCNNNTQGWYAIVNDNKISAGFENIPEKFLYFFCRVSCINSNLYHEKPEFEEYTPVQLKWPEYTNKVERNIYKSNLTTATALLNINIDNIDKSIENLIKTYDKYSIISLKLESKEKLPKIITYGNCQVVHNGYKVELSTNSEKIILLYGIMNEIRDRLKCFIHFIIRTPGGIINDSSYKLL